jgi:hypothetical protein
VTGEKTTPGRNYPDESYLAVALEDFANFDGIKPSRTSSQIAVLSRFSKACLGSGHQLTVGRLRSGSPSTATAAPTCLSSGRILREPIAEFQVFPDFTAFVAVLFRFVWPVIDLAEGVFGVANYVRDNVECFRHGSDPLLSILETAFSEKSANSPEEFPCCRSNAAIGICEVVST